MEVLVRVHDLQVAVTLPNILSDSGLFLTLKCYERIDLRGSHRVSYRPASVPGSRFSVIRSQPRNRAPKS
jgi:hypothetical protein